MNRRKKDESIAPILVNLQLFAEGDKTEKATPKKRQDARKKGQVLQSKEVNTVFVLLFVFIGLKLFGSTIYGEIRNFFIRLIEEYSGQDDLFTVSILSKIFVESLSVLLKTLGPIFAIAMISGLILSYAQVGFLFTLEAIGFKFDRINPISGLKRIFSMRALVELLKSVLKIVIIGYTAYAYLKGEAENILNLAAMEPVEVATYIGATSINVALRICYVLIFLAAADYFYQWWDFEKNLRMSKQEIKEEYKQTEGNPEIKSKIKQKQRQMSMRRMMQEIPKADVVITNPTHFAVAVKYDQSEGDAPKVLAKGQDFIALRIKEIAKENNIEIVENKPLARALFSTVEIGEAIPQELYQAVAEVLAFVYSLKK